MKCFVFAVVLCGLLFAVENKAKACPVAIVRESLSVCGNELFAPRIVLRQVVPRAVIVREQVIRQRVRQRPQPIRAALREFQR